MVMVTGWLVATTALAQTRPWALVKPWEPGTHWAETLDDLVFVGQGETKSANLDISTFYWDSTGRVRLERDNADPKFVVGYKILSVGADAQLGAVNGSFWDVAVTAGGRAAEWGDGYRLYLMGGAGSVNDDHWRNDDAFYGLGTVGVSRRVDADTEWFAGIEYNGNRFVFPDVPAPFVAWRHRLGSHSWVALGLPMGGLHIEPVKKVLVDAHWDLLADGELRVSYSLLKNLHFFAQYTHTLDGYAINGVEHRRLFAQFERVGAGIRWINKWFDVSLSAGYVLEQDYRQGYDLRQTTRVADVSDEPFVALRIVGKM